MAAFSLTGVALAKSIKGAGAEFGNRAVGVLGGLVDAAMNQIKQAGPQHRRYSGCGG